MSLTLNVEFPALDRLCAWLEGRDKAGLLEAIETEILAKLKEAAESGVPRPVFKEVEPAEDHPWKDEAKAGEPTAVTEPMPPTTDAAPPAKAEKAEERAQVTLADVQQACARLRDAGKMNEVKALFPEFGIKKLSDLKSAEQLAAFAARLKKLEG